MRRPRREKPPSWRDAPSKHGFVLATVSELTRFDTSAFTPVRGVRVAVAVVAALAIGLVAGNHAAGATMAAGALLTVIPTVVTPQRVSLAALVAISLAMGVTVFLGSVTGSTDWLHVLLLAPVSFLGGLLLGQRTPAGSVGSQAIVAMVVFGRFAAPPLGALSLAGYVLAGSGVAFAVLALTRPPLTARAQREALAAVARSIAAMARAPGGRRSGIASAEEIEAAEQLLARQLGDRRDHEVLRALLDVLGRARLAILAIDGTERRVVRTSGGKDSALLHAVDDHVTVAGAHLEAVARAVVGPPSAAGLGALADLERREAPDGAGAGERAALAAYLGALDGQVRAANDLAARVGTGQHTYSLRGSLSGRRNARARAHEFLEGLVADATLASPVGRHAIRLAAVICIAEVIALATPLARGYWIALTAAIVLRPEFSTTIGRGVARTVGTSLGVLLAGLLLLGIRAIDPADVVAIGLLTALTAATFQVSYVLFSGLLTGLVVLLLGIVSAGTFATALDRLLDTVIGGVLALGTYALWPTWTRTTGPPALADLVERQAAYLAAVLAMVTGWQKSAPGALTPLSRAARRARSVAQSVIAQGLLEPAARRLDVARSQGSLAALSRISLQTHALRSGLQTGAPPEPAPALAPLADGFVTALYRVAEALRADEPPSPRERVLRARSAAANDRARGALPPLRQLYEQALAADPALPPALLAQCDELVDAIDTLGAAVDLAPAAPAPETGGQAEA